MHELENGLTYIGVFATVLSVFFILAAIYVQSKRRIEPELIDDSSQSTEKEEDLESNTDPMNRLEALLHSVEEEDFNHKKNGNGAASKPVAGILPQFKTLTRYSPKNSKGASFFQEEDGMFIWE